MMHRDDQADSRRRPRRAQGLVGSSPDATAQNRGLIYQNLPFQLFSIEFIPIPSPLPPEVSYLGPSPPCFSSGLSFQGYLNNPPTRESESDPSSPNTQQSPRRIVTTIMRDDAA
jgi:hypothetical protein